MALYTKLDLFNDINALVERYIEQELAVNKKTDEAEIEVEKDAMGHFIDMKTGDIWDLDEQKIVGQKDLTTGKCTCHPEHELVTEASIARLLTPPEKESKEPEPIKEPIKESVMEPAKEPVTEPAKEPEVKKRSRTKK